MDQWLPIIFLTLLICAISFIYFFAKKSKPQSFLSISTFFSTSSNLPILTITANSILLDSNYHLLPNIDTFLMELFNNFVIYIFVEVKDDQHLTHVENDVYSAFQNIISKENILFCQTSIGRSPMCRQLESNLHIEYDIDAARLNSIYCPTAFISPTKPDNLNTQFHASSLIEFFTLYHDPIQNFL